MDSGLEDFEGNNKKMRKGQVGCFFSHYTIWKKVEPKIESNFFTCFFQQMVEEKLNTVLVMEDDVKFRTFFKSGLPGVIREANTFTPDWDFM